MWNLPNKLLNRWTSIWTVTLLYGLFFFWILGIPVADWTSTIVGSGPDPYQYIWNADVFHQQLKNGQNPFFTHRFFYPTGTSLLMHTYTPIIGFVNLALNNPYLACNVVLLLSFIISGLGGFLLAKRFLRSRILAFLVGFIFAYSPFKTAHLMEHYHLLLTAHVPFYVLSVLHFFPQGNIRMSRKTFGGVLVLLSLGILSVLGDYYTTFYLLIFTGVYFLYFPLKKLWVKTHFRFRWLAVLAFIFGFHFVMEFLYHHPKLDDKGAIYNSSDVAALFVPAENSGLYQSPFLVKLRTKMQFKGPNEQVVFLGFGLVLVLIFLIFYFLKNRMNPPPIWTFLALFFLILCFPKIKFLGNTVLYTPLSWLHLVPFFNHIRNPSRAVMMVYLFLPMAIFVALEMVQWKKEWLGKLVFATILLVTVVEFSPKTYAKISKTDVPSQYIELAKNPDIQTIWHIPTGAVDGFRLEGVFDIRNSQQQIVHQKNIIGGYVSRVDSATFEYFAKNPILQFANDSEATETHFEIQELKDFIRYHSINVLIFDTNNEQGKIISELLKDHIKTISHHPHETIIILQ